MARTKLAFWDGLAVIAVGWATDLPGASLLAGDAVLVTIEATVRRVQRCATPDRSRPGGARFVAVLEHPRA